MVDRETIGTTSNQILQAGHEPLQRQRGETVSLSIFEGDNYHSKFITWWNDFNKAPWIYDENPEIRKTKKTKQLLNAGNWTKDGKNFKRLVNALADDPRFLDVQDNTKPKDVVFNFVSTKKGCTDKVQVIFRHNKIETKQSVYSSISTQQETPQPNHRKFSKYSLDVKAKTTDLCRSNVPAKKIYGELLSKFPGQDIPSLEQIKNIIYRKLNAPGVERYFTLNGIIDYVNSFAIKENPAHPMTKDQPILIKNKRMQNGNILLIWTTKKMRNIQKRSRFLITDVVFKYEGVDVVFLFAGTTDHILKFHVTYFGIVSIASKENYKCFINTISLDSGNYQPDFLLTSITKKFVDVAFKVFRRATPIMRWLSVENNNLRCVNQLYIVNHNNIDLITGAAGLDFVTPASQCQERLEQLLSQRQLASKNDVEQLIAEIFKYDWSYSAELSWSDGKTHHTSETVFAEKTITFLNRKYDKIGLKIGEMDPTPESLSLISKFSEKLRELDITATEEGLVGIPNLKLDKLHVNLVNNFVCFNDIFMRQEVKYLSFTSIGGQFFDDIAQITANCNSINCEQLVELKASHTLNWLSPRKIVPVYNKIINWFPRLHKICVEVQYSDGLLPENTDAQNFISFVVEQVAQFSEFKAICSKMSNATLEFMFDPFTYDFICDEEFEKQFVEEVKKCTCFEQAIETIDRDSEGTQITLECGGQNFSFKIDAIFLSKENDSPEYGAASYNELTGNNDQEAGRSLAREFWKSLNIEFSQGSQSLVCPQIQATMLNYSEDELTSFNQPNNTIDLDESSPKPGPSHTQLYQ